MRSRPAVCPRLSLSHTIMMTHQMHCPHAETAQKKDGWVDWRQDNGLVAGGWLENSSLHYFVVFEYRQGGTGRLLVGEDGICLAHHPQYGGTTGARARLQYCLAMPSFQRGDMKDNNLMCMSRAAAGFSAQSILASGYQYFSKGG